MNTPTASQQLRAALRTWTILNNTSLGEVAQHLGVSQALLSLWVAGRRRIGYGAAKEIEGITGGAACPEDWPWMWHEAERREYRHPGAGREDGAPRRAAV